MEVIASIIAPTLFLALFVRQGTETNAVTDSVMTDEEWTELRETDSRDKNKKANEALSDLNTKANKAQSQVEIPTRTQNKGGKTLGFGDEIDAQGNARGAGLVDRVKVWAVQDHPRGLRPVGPRGGE